MKKTDPTPIKKSTDSSQFFWFSILAASLLLNAYVLYYKKEKSGEVLATGMSQTFRWKDVSEAGKAGLSDLDATYYSRLKAEADQWAENLVLPKEAQAQGIGLEALIKKEITDKVQVTPADVTRRYVMSPAADAKPFPQVQDEIRRDLEKQNYSRVKKELLDRLFAKYGIQFRLKAPQGYDRSMSDLSAFPVYTPPPAQGTLDPSGKITTSPSRGPADAPVVVEIYSDFMCPFSKRFHGTMKALDQKYPGKIRTVFHHFPLAFHKGADVMAEASTCAQEQGKFWEYHDRLMDSKESSLDKAGLVALASELGLNGAAFQSCLDSQRYKEWVALNMASGTKNGVSGTPGFLVNGRKGFGAKPPEDMAKLIDWHLNPQGQYPGAIAPAPAQGAGAAKPAAPAIDPNKVYVLNEAWVKKGPASGPDNAPITIVEFVDFNCPFCQRGNNVVNELLKKYPGKIKLVSKNLPLPFHPEAQMNAEAALCAHDQGKFHEFRAEIFGASWGKKSKDDMKAIAKQLSLNETTFAACLDGGNMKARADEDKAMAGQNGASGTPTFFINGKMIVGAQPIENFSKVIDEILASKK